MRWIFIIGILVMTTAVLSQPSRRNWPHVKNVISKGLFGRNTAIIVQQPEIPEHKTYQLYKIDGYENILINLTRRENFETKKPRGQKLPPTEPISKSEIDILSNYLGTNKEDTLVALEALQSLLKSGILDSVLTENLEDRKGYNTPELKPVEVYVQENEPNIDVRFASEEKNKIYNGNENNSRNKDKENDKNVVSNIKSPVKDSQNNDQNHKVDEYTPHEYIFVPPTDESTSPPNNTYKTAKPNKRVGGKTKSKRTKNRLSKDLGNGDH